jgi:hypothetical protein
MLSWHEIERRAVAFQKTWKNCAGDERQEAQTFEKDLMYVFGIDWRDGLHEHQITLRDGSIGYIDYFLPGKILIEMKSKGQSLTKAYSQAMTYVHSLKPDEIPVLVLVSDFEKFHVYNLKKNHPYKPFKVSQLKSRVRIFGLLAGYGVLDEEKTEIEVNTEASYMMARIHDEMKTNGYEGHALEVYLVRLLFCMFADDTGIFERDSFSNYLKNSAPDGSDLSSRLMILFSVLNTPLENRMTNISAELARFRYINGELFAESLPPAFFDVRTRQLLIECSDKFDWSQISPSIFGAMFQGVMNPEERRTLGAHYTSEENIMKVIEPLFLDELHDEFEKVKSTTKELQAFQDKIASLKFLDPAMGSGNFLIVAYKKLRELEFEILKLIIDESSLQIVDAFIKVSIDQFYGIEIEEFPCQIAQVSLILIKHLMDIEVSNYFGFNIIDFPIKNNANIVHGNALVMDWNLVCPAEELNYILGNPPFIGYSNQSREQTENIKSIYLDESGKTSKTAGKIDFVAGWFYKASEMMLRGPIKASFVATNSITQGEQVYFVWNLLLGLFNIHIDFAYRTFKWTNDAKGKAAVHCVIIGFSRVHHRKKKYLWDEYSQMREVSAINPYLVEGENILVKSRTKPLNDVSTMVYGSKPTDGGFLLLDKSEKESILLKYPEARDLIRPYLGSKEFLHNLPRYCIWLEGVSPAAYAKIPPILDRISQVKCFRLASKKEKTRKDADKPMLFQENRQPTTFYLLVPRVSSEKRQYIPIGYLPPDTICGDQNLMIPDASLYEFGVLTSAAHMSWMRLVAGRLKSDFRYSASIVYNTFPWCDSTVTANVY